MNANLAGTFPGVVATDPHVFYRIPGHLPLQAGVVHRSNGCFYGVRHGTPTPQG